MRRVSTVYVLNANNQLLMVYNKTQKAWLPPGGFIEGEELEHECAIRETKEESGEKIGGSLIFLGNSEFKKAKIDERSIILPVPLFVVKQTLTSGEVVINYNYLARTNCMEIEVSRFKAEWFSFKEAKKLDIFDNVRMQIEVIENNLRNYREFPDEVIKPTIDMSVFKGR